MQFLALLASLVVQCLAFLCAPPRCDLAV